MSETKYYYKTQDGKGLLCLKHKETSGLYIQITKEQFEELVNQNEESEGI